MQGAPIDGLYSGLVLPEPCQWLVGGVCSYLPDHQFVIVAPRGKNFVIVRTPAKATDLLFVTLEILDDEVALCPNVSNFD